MDLDRLATPTLILERAIVTRNTKRMGARMAAHGVALRPHLKTAKSAQVAALAVAGQAGGITVSTLAEAAYFLDHGFSDITYAVGIVAGKLPAVADLMARGADLKILTDNLDAARAIAAFDGAAQFKVLIEIDCGDARTGLLSDSPQLIAVAQIIDGAANAEPWRPFLPCQGHRGDQTGCARRTRGSRWRCTTAARCGASLPGGQRRIHTDRHPRRIL
jgi:D-serine deaminase-like pyridoxal phosphate-dependent protein